MHAQPPCRGCARTSSSAVCGARLHSMRPARRNVVTTQASFSFAHSQRADSLAPGVRRNRQIEKRQEQELRSVAHGLCNFNAKQLAAVAHLLTEEHLKQIRIGMDIPKTNQGRKRQAGLVMKLLRADLDEATLAKLAEAVGQAAEHNLPYGDRDVEQQLQVWVEGLLADDQEVVQEVYGLVLAGSQQDAQQLRQWVRQLQQHTQQQHVEQQPEQEDAGSWHEAGESSGAPTAAAEQAAPAAAVPVSDPEVLQLMQEFGGQQQLGQQQRQRARGRSRSNGGGSSSSNTAASARRSIRKLLKPHAVAMHAVA